MEAEVNEALAGIGRRDHSNTSEYRIFGPPGTGKTTQLARQVRRAVERFGPESVLVASFSRAAAAEVAGRDLPISSERIGTLHSHCFHALGRPLIAEAHVDDWNRKNPQWQITPAKKQMRLEGEDAGEEDGRMKAGDLWLQQLNQSRGRMIPPQTWSAGLRDFERRWQEYKDAGRLFDFTDLIEICYRDVAVAPGKPVVIFADEAQDLNRMQLSLFRNWGRHCGYSVICGDEDQTVYSFNGASPEAMLDPPIPHDHEIVLQQSYRVPRGVHAAADKIIQQVTRRYAKAYLPRPAAGSYLRGPLSATYSRPDCWIFKSATQHIAKGQTVMFLASCAYMLQPIIAVLRKWGVPFHNPYRRSNGFWNPLRLGGKEASANRILSLLSAHPDYGNRGTQSRTWTYRDFQCWAGWLCSTGVLKPNALAQIAASVASQTVAAETLCGLFEAGALESLRAAFGGDYRQLLDWWRRHLAPAFRPRVQFPIQVAWRNGADALKKPPKVIVGTIHSVKGGEAHVVFLFPDLSKAGWAAYQRHGPQRDAVLRLFYVGMTRAREALYVCQKGSSTAVTIR